MRSAAVASVVVAGCGRVAFDPVAVAGSGHGFQRTISVTDVAPLGLPIGYATRVALDVIAPTDVRPDLSDLQVLRGDGTQVDRVVDSVGGVPSALWFSLAAGIASGATDDQYELVYGDPAAEPALVDGTHVFAVYDDFVAPQLAPTWQIQGTPALASGELTIRAGTNGDGIGTQAAADGVPLIASFEVRARITDLNSAPGSYYYWFGFQTPFAPVAPFTNWVARSSSSIHGEYCTTGPPCDVAPYCVVPTVAQTTAYRVFRIDRFADRQVFWVDGAIDGSVTVATTTDAGIEIRNFAMTSGLVVDWVRARGIADPEPTVVVGPESPR